MYHLKRCPDCRHWRYDRMGSWCNLGERVTYPTYYQSHVTAERIECKKFKLLWKKETKW